MSVPERRVRRLELKADAHKKRRLKRHVQLAITLDLRPEYLAKSMLRGLRVSLLVAGGAGLGWCIGLNPVSLIRMFLSLPLTF